MKRIVSLVLALSMVLSMFSMSFAGSSLKDIENTKYEAAVEALIELGVVSGYPDGTYLPNNVVTRAELAKLLVVAYGLEPAAEASKGVTPFDDVNAINHWASGYINVSADYKFVNGYPDGSFKGDETVTYAEAITMCLRVLGYANEIDSKGTWPTNYIAKAQDLKLMKDIDFASYNDGAKRGDIALLIWNMLRTKMWTVTGETDGDGLEYRPNEEMLNVKFADYRYDDEAIFDGYRITSDPKEDKPLVEMIVNGTPYEYTKNDFYTFVPGTEVEVLLNTEEKVLLTMVPTEDNRLVEGTKEAMVDEDYNTLYGVDFDYVYGLVETRDVANNTMLTATSYHIDKVETNAKGKMTLTSNNLQTLSFTESEREAELFLENGERVELDGIKAGDILTKVTVAYADGAADEREFWVIGSEKVEGELTEYVVKAYDDGVGYHFITVDGEKYYVAQNARYVEDTTKSKITTQAFYGIEDDKMNGEEIVVKLDPIFGKVVRVEFDGKIDAGSDTVTWKFFGAASDVYVDGKGYAIELQDSNGTTEYSFRDKTAGKELFGLDARVQGGFLAIQLDENDEIADYELLAYRSKDGNGEYTIVNYGNLTDLLYGEEADNEKYVFTQVENGVFDDDNNKFANMPVTDATKVVRLVFDDNGTAKTSDDECYVEFAEGLAALENVSASGEAAITISDAASELDVLTYVVLFSERQDKSGLQVGKVTDVNVNSIDELKQSVSIEDGAFIEVEEGTAILEDYQLIVYKEKENAKGNKFVSFITGLLDSDLVEDNGMPVVDAVSGKSVKYVDGTQVDYSTKANTDKYEEYFVVTVSVSKKDDVQYEISSYDTCDYVDVVFAEDDRVLFVDDKEVMFIISGMSYEEVADDNTGSDEGEEELPGSGETPVVPGSGETPVVPGSGETPVVPGSGETPAPEAPATVDVKVVQYLYSGEEFVSSGEVTVSVVANETVTLEEIPQVEGYDVDSAKNNVLAGTYTEDFKFEVYYIKQVATEPTGV